MIHSSPIVHLGDPSCALCSAVSPLKSRGRRANGYPWCSVPTSSCSGLKRATIQAPNPITAQIHGNLRAVVHFKFLYLALTLILVIRFWGRRSAQMEMTQIGGRPGELCSIRFELIGGGWSSSVKRYFVSVLSRFSLSCSTNKSHYPMDLLLSQPVHQDG